MIKKDHQIPDIIPKLTALLQRIPKTHQHKIPTITEDLRIRTAGYQGEKAIDYPLSFLNDQDYYIFHGLRLQTKSHHFQIDTLIFTKQLVILNEVKNISGTIYFDQEFKQLIQTKDGIEKGYSYPLTQLDRQAALFQEWLKLNKLPKLKLATLVVISNSQSIIRTAPNSNSINQRVIHKEDLPMKIRQIEKSHSHISETLDEKDMKKIFKCLIKQHSSLETNVLERYQINEHELRKGVFCPRCEYFPLERIKANWYCPQCKHKDKFAHIQALKDYSLLIKPTIKNSEAREFLVLNSSSTANRLLHGMNLQSSGGNKNRQYDLTHLKYL